MTQRETEILSYLKQNPMISQQELADILGIERSSVAVHISNLTKKGVIKGKGYLLQPEKYVLVIGGSNMDILGTPTTKLIMEDSNPGTITTSPGGVGRNIAENLAHLGVATKLLSAVGNDSYGEQILNQTQSAGVDIHHVKRLSTASTSIYMSILDDHNDMKVAISHMDITKEINISYIKSNSNLITNAEHIIIDTNLDQEVIDFLLLNFQESRFIVDTVSISKSTKIKSHLQNIFCLKPNLLEASAIINKPLNTMEEIKNALITLHSKGVNHPMITLGKKGIAYLNNQKVEILKPIVTQIINANGAGDAFTAGISYGFFNNFTISNIVMCGQKAATIALNTEDTVNKNLSQTDLKL